jgi:NADPH2:quinone reductase
MDGRCPAHHRINAATGRNIDDGAEPMRAMMSETPGGPESLKLMELPSKPLGKGQVRVAVKAAGVNFPDTLIIADKYQFKPPRPFAPGHEVAGDITEVGEGVSGYKKGDRVIGMIGHGGYATEAVVDEGALLPMPPNMSYEDGSAFTMTYGTSYYALKQRSDYKPGETLLVTGASGGVGLTAVELGALMGLKVIAAVGSDEKIEICRKYGATMFVNYAKEKMRDKVKELTGGNGADIIYDAVGGDAFDESIRCIAWYGRLLVVGFAAGRIPSLPANLALLKSCDVRGVFYGAWRAREPVEARKNFDELLKWYSEGKLKPHISMRFPLEKGADAMNALLSRKATGKVVLTVA